MQRIGVFVCHCGSNIAATVDVKKVVELAAKEPGVVHAEATSTCAQKQARLRFRKPSKRRN